MKKTLITHSQNSRDFPIDGPSSFMGVYWPILTFLIMILGSVLGFLISGNYFQSYNLNQTFQEADISLVLVIVSFLSLVISLTFSSCYRLCRFLDLKKEILNSWKGISSGVLILFLAWALSSAIRSLGTIQLLIDLLLPLLSSWAIPIGTFVMGCLISFITGTAWGTLAILFPIAVSVAYDLGGIPVMVITMGAALEGAIFGNHTSPFSETTIMSSLAARCSVESHVRTQLPYSLMIAAVSVFIGYFFTAYFSLPPGMALVLGIGVIVFWYLALKRRSQV